MTAVVLSLALANSVSILDRAHSHNDYYRSRPLIEALEQGFASVEVDVFLIEGKLLVGHDAKDLKPDRTIESLYFDPLRERIRKNGGWVYPGVKKALWVLVDQKGRGGAAFDALQEVAAKYPEFKLGKPDAAVRLVVSGDRPVANILLQNGEVASLDGRWGDLGKGISTSAMPWVSEAWLSHFHWIGGGRFPYFQQKKLEWMVDQAHSHGYKIRFWGAPDTPAIWQAQWDAGVDFINTDRPKSLRDWMIRR